jgi:carbonic anhydrase
VGAWGCDAARCQYACNGAPPARAACQSGTREVPGTMPHWSYMEAAEWSSLSPSYAMCDGMSQTPLDLPLDAPTTTAGLTFNNYGAIPRIVLNNGHTLQATYRSNFGAGDPSVTFDGQTYYLVQFHLHAPAEHQIGGRQFAMEAHFVHAVAPSAGPSLVVGVMLEFGAANPTVAALLENPPAEHREVAQCDRTIDLAPLLPARRGFYHYAAGSLTTPPCTMGLNWFVLDAPLTIAATQQSRLLAVTHGDNNRPIQPRNGRRVVRFRAAQ